MTALLLSNSLGTSRGMWDGLLPALEERMQVIRYDMRGHGGTPAPPGPYSIADLGRDALEVLHEAGVERASFCGVSLGGMVGMWLALNAPERIERLVLCCTFAHMPPADGWHERAATVRADGMKAVVDATLERWFTPVAPPEAVARTRQMVLSTDPEGYAGCCEAIAGHDMREQLGGIRAPTLVISAEDDPSTPPDHGRLIADSVPGARFTVL